MAQFLMFVYALILINISLFFVEATELNIPCVAVDDCPKVEKPLNMWCMHQYCVYGFIKPYK
ncbi:Nodule Cysteine-Rich (NCR) secreted peptide [Medicago truncatula]|uniref:Nodule Cysteine-Rich (NCR) secreted peptide n=1 Tax=Medicago truncatula TaxID=3880 RepID=A0A072UA23_MEDTR|nr:Nodule Cysteine-Rich (NCR) secreted peptide [Medicago truncatula]